MTNVSVSYITDQGNGLDFNHFHANQRFSDHT